MLDAGVPTDVLEDAPLDQRAAERSREALSRLVPAWSVPNKHYEIYCSIRREFQEIIDMAEAEAAA